MPANHAHILIIDEAKEAEKLADLLRIREFSCDTTHRLEEAETWLKKGKFDCLITELALENFDGIKLVRDFQTKHPKLPIVMLTKEQSSDVAIGAIQAGAYDCLLKPVDIDELNDVVTNAVEDARRMSKPVEIGEVYPDQDTIVGKSRAMREIYKQLGRIAAQPVTVLIRGETGTGKELIARAIYQHGHRAHKPFVAVNCASIPDALLESELFGHEKGSFTGADKMRLGRFEQAHGGTLFLDEIGDLDLSLQAKMLRVLQEKTIQRVGGNKDIPVDVRVIAATHRNLEKMVADGEFREDLIYRLNVAKVTIPPLRERREDIPALIDYFLTRFATEYGIEGPSIAPKAVEFLRDQDWPGNIRQLQNVIRRALLASRGYTIGWHDCRDILEDTEVAEREASPSFHQLVSETLSKVVEGELESALPELTASFEREVYGQAIKRSAGNQAKAARWLGVSRLTLREKLRQYGLHPGGQ